MPFLSSPRGIYFLIAFGCAAAMCFGFYLQYVEHLEPCPLCMTQRVFIVLAGLIALIAGIHNPGKTGRWIYTGLGTLSAMVGAGFAGRHVWLQSLPEDQVPACGPSLEYMLDTLPLTETLQIMLTGDGNCAEEVWSMMGLSIPAWTLVGFAIAITLYVVTLLLNSD